MGNVPYVFPLKYFRYKIPFPAPVILPLFSDSADIFWTFVKCSLQGSLRLYVRYAVRDMKETCRKFNDHSRSEN